MPMTYVIYVCTKLYNNRVYVYTQRVQLKLYNIINLKLKLKFYKKKMNNI